MNRMEKGLIAVVLVLAGFASYVFLSARTESLATLEKTAPVVEAVHEQPTWTTPLDTYSIDVRVEGQTTGDYSVGYIPPTTGDLPDVEESSWTPEAGTPSALLDPKHWPTVEPTLENLMRQMREQDRYSLLTDEQFAIAWSKPGFPEEWAKNREHLALGKYVIQYESREETRHNTGLPSIALEDELQPVVSFIAALNNPEAAWKEINAYSTSFIDSIRLADVPLSKRDSASSKWRALRELKRQAQPHASFIDQTLENL